MTHNVKYKHSAGLGAIHCLAYRSFLGAKMLNLTIKLMQCVCPAWATGIEDTTLFQRVQYMTWY